VGGPSTCLLGSWDNYYATPSNYYLYNSGRLGTADDFMHSPYFTFIPWDYDNCLVSITSARNGSTNRHSRLAQQHQALLAEPRDLTDPAVAEPAAQPRLPAVLPDYLETLLETQFHPDAFGQQIAADSGDGLWGRISQAAYLESATPYGQPFTGRQFTNDEMYLTGCKQNELRHGQEKADGIVHYGPHATRQRAPATGATAQADAPRH